MGQAPLDRVPGSNPGSGSRMTDSPETDFVLHRNRPVCYNTSNLQDCREGSKVKKRLKEILKKEAQYNAGDMVQELFGLSQDVHYAALVVAPGWKPTKILNLTNYEVQVTAEHSYFSGYEVTMGDKRIAWIQCASGACNLIDHLSLCACLDFTHLIFAGACGGLKADFPVGTVCTPSVCISGSMAEAYLLEDMRSWTPFQEVKPGDMTYVDEICELADFPVKKARVFCTDSIVCEYDHLDFIRSFDADLIEMETSAFYTLADLMDKPAIALLVVSDNSASGEPFLGRGEEQKAAYNYGRKVLIPRFLEKIANK